MLQSSFTNTAPLCNYPCHSVPGSGQSGHGHFGQNRFSGNEHRVTACLAPCDGAKFTFCILVFNQLKFQPVDFHPCRLHLSDGFHYVTACLAPCDVRGCFSFTSLNGILKYTFKAIISCSRVHRSFLAIKTIAIVSLLPLSPRRHLERFVQQTIP